jgi:hypothetical protein
MILVTVGQDDAEQVLARFSMKDRSGRTSSMPG